MIAAARGGYDLSHDLTTGGPVRDLLFVIVGIVVLLAFIVAARLIAHLAGQQLLKRHVRGDMVVLGRRVVTALVIVIGVFAALGFAVENANVPLFGLLLATVVAALGVQDLLRDYVSGYYVLLERHIRVGDRVSFDGDEGLITDVRLRVTLLRNDQGDVVVVPNSELFTKSVTIRARGEATTAPPE
jgi:small conductance mechanosensitive channel